MLIFAAGSTGHNRGDLHKSIDAYRASHRERTKLRPCVCGAGQRLRAVWAKCLTTTRLPLTPSPRARQAAERALQLDSQSGEAHSVLAHVSFSYDWDFEAAVTRVPARTNTRQNDPTAHQWFSHYCIVRNRLQEALEENSRTLGLDPVSPLFNTSRAEILYNARQYDAAIAQARRTIEQYPTYPLAYIWLGSAYREKKMYKEALEQFSQGLKFSGNSARNRGSIWTPRSLFRGM